MKKILKDYFTFSKKESIAVLIILSITAIVIALPYFYSSKKAKEPVNAELAKIATATIFIKDSTNNANNDEGNYRHKNYSYAKKETETHTINPFTFDPNTIDENGWHKLGLPDKTIKTILNYRSKGGKFKTAGDIRKIWGLKKEDADILVPYITIASATVNNKYPTNYNKNFAKATPTIIDINTETVEEFKQLPAVGNIAYKIIKFREKLGGFISINQIKETYNLTDSVYTAMLPYLSYKPFTLAKININTASDFELGGHPYISKDVAKAIVIYRTQHGNYAKVEDIKKIVFIKQDVLNKIAPYLTVE